MIDSPGSKIIPAYTSPIIQPETVRTPGLDPRAELEQILSWEVAGIHRDSISKAHPIQHYGAKPEGWCK